MNASFPRRQAIAATVALLAAARAATPRGAFAQSATTPEVKKAALGYIALTDAAPLLIAKEKGFFAKYGMADVEVSKQASWGAARDNLVLGGERGGLDGSHMLSTMPYLMQAGKITQNSQPVLMTLLARTHINGQAISVAKKYMALGARLDARPLKAVLTPDSKVAHTFRGGTHDLWVRYWLAAAGIDPDKDVQTIVVPPPQMVANMKVGTMDAFCVAEPWHAQLVNQGLGYTACMVSEILRDHPDKSFAMRTDWVQRHPRAAEAILAAIIDAQRWCDDRANTTEMCTIIGRRAWMNVPVADILSRAQGEIDYGDGRRVENSPIAMKYWNDHASYPWPSHDLLMLTENIRWGQLPEATDIKALVATVNGEAIWRAGAERAGVKPGETPSGTSRGRETFFDGKVFDPENPAAYLASQPIKKLVGV